MCFLAHSFQMCGSYRVNYSTREIRSSRFTRPTLPHLGTIETDYLASLRAASIFRFVHLDSKARKALGAAFSINSRRCHWGRDGRRKQALWSTSCH
jgi:hypothetical protein